MSPVVHISKAVFGDSAIGLHHPIIKHQQHFAIDLRRFHFIDDQRPIEAAILLVPAPCVRVIPIRPSILEFECVTECATRRDVVLGQRWCAIHGVGNPQAMPVKTGGLREAVVERDIENVALPIAQQWAGNLPIIGPHIEIQITYLRIDDGQLGWLWSDHALLGSACQSWGNHGGARDQARPSQNMASRESRAFAGHRVPLWVHTRMLSPLEHRSSSRATNAPVAAMPVRR
jgi:hypothetical protein